MGIDMSKLTKLHTWTCVFIVYQFYLLKAIYAVNQWCLMTYKWTHLSISSFLLTLSFPFIISNWPSSLKKGLEMQQWAKLVWSLFPLNFYSWKETRYSNAIFITNCMITHHIRTMSYENMEDTGEGLGVWEHCLVSGWDLKNEELTQQRGKGTTFQAAGLVCAKALRWEET